MADDFFVVVHIPLINERLFYKYFLLRSVGKATKGRNVGIWKCEFILFNKNRRLIFSVHIPLIYENLYYKYFLRQSIIQALKGSNVKI